MTGRLARGAATAAVAAALVGLVGCNSKSDVSGKVTYNGKSVTSGSVSLIARDGIQYSGQIDAGGSYAIAGVPSGSVKILVSSPNPEGANRGGKKKGVGDNDLAGTAGAGGGTGAAGWFPVPEKYSDVTATDLTGDVKGNPATLNIDLK